jgi:hypothetical protein
VSSLFTQDRYLGLYLFAFSYIWALGNGFGRLDSLADAVRGLGVVICEKFAKEGCNVAVNYVNSKEQSDELAVRLESEHKVKAYTIRGVSDLPFFFKSREGRIRYLGNGRTK